MAYCRFYSARQLDKLLVEGNTDLLNYEVFFLAKEIKTKQP